MNNKIFLSIIIPVYNTEKYIVDCLTTVCNQSGNVPYEVIIINDGSEDNSLALIERFILNSSSINNIKLFSINNCGQSGARNLGISKAEGKYICFVDSDDWVSLDLLQSTSSVAKKTNFPDIIYYDRVLSFPDRNERIIYDSFCGLILDNEEVFSKINMSACNKLYKRSIIGDDIRFPIGKIYEDVPFSIDMLIASKTITKCQCFLYFVRQDTPNSITNKFNDNETDMVSMLNLCEFKLLNSSNVIKSEFSKYKDKTLLYWVVKLIRYQSVDMLKDNKITLFLNKNNVSSKFEKIFCVLINHKKFRLLSIIIKINDWMKK